jgi:hypothetical protein
MPVFRVLENLLYETIQRYNLDMCYSVQFHEVLINTPTNAQLLLLFNDLPTCFDPVGSSSGLYIEYQKLRIKMCIKYLLKCSPVHAYAVKASVKMCV